MWWVILWIWCETCNLQHEKAVWLEDPTEAPVPGEAEWHGGEQDRVGWKPRDNSPLDDLLSDEEETQ